jgi:hypothetical protein
VETATAHLELSIEVGSDPIAGSVTNGSYRSRPFSGWIELVGAIEAARSAGVSTRGSGEAGRQTLGSSPGAKAPEL